MFIDYVYKLICLYLYKLSNSCKHVTATPSSAVKTGNGRLCWYCCKTGTSQCFTETDLYPVYYYEMVLAWIQVVFWSSMFMYKTSGSSTSSTRPTILWVLVRGNSDYSILDVISHVCCALVSFQQIASCARRVLLQRRCSVFASY